MVALDERSKGLLLVLGTAIVSGVSVYLNKHALASFSDPFAFTAMKNLAVAALVLAGILLLSKSRELSRLSRRDWGSLLAIGLVGGSVPFMLFFWGLAQTGAATASLLQKTLFIPATALAFIFLKERLSKAQLAGSLLLFAGAAAFSGVAPQALGIGECAIIGAVLLWSAEDVISKTVLRALAPETVVFGRMFFGSLAILALLAATSRAPDVASLSGMQLAWLAFTALLLLAYNLTFYSGLKRIKVGEATAVLVAGSLVTSALSLLDGAVPSPVELLALAAMLAGAVAVCMLPSAAIRAAGKPASA
ncbi:MAG: DMT family transporter [Candidatus ainarchaeum sp.]|nr:DMT family transporter [Candidatus ainarchaeum sp.]